MDFLTITEAREQLPKLDKTLLRNKDDVVVITRHGKPELLIQLYDSDFLTTRSTIREELVSLKKKIKKSKKR